jgi:hypothetical protein
MNTLQKLHRIEKEKTIYDIHWCRAGVGIIFWEPPKGYKKSEYSVDEWRNYLIVDQYYSSFVRCINAEYKRIIYF